MDNNPTAVAVNPIHTLLNEMAYEILIVHKKAKEYSRMLEQMLMCPTAMLGKDLSWTWANEGRNEFIRAMINGAHKHMNQKPKDNTIKKVKRSRKEVVGENN